MTGFQHSIAGGQGNLIATSIQSPNFVSGQSGWRIAKDGSAEFQDITIPPGSGGATVYIQDTQPDTPNPGDLWLDTTSGLQLSQWDGTQWNPYQFGTDAIVPGSIDATLIAADAVVAGTVAAGAIDGMTINAPVINGGTVSATDVIVSGTNGGMFAYGPGGGGQQVETFTSSATWTAPAGVTSAQVECWGGGGNGAAGDNSSGGGGGGGGGEYAAEPALTVIPGNSYAVVVGAANNKSTFNSTDVVAHGAGNASGTGGGGGGSGSTNTVHRNGGPGGHGSTGTVTVETFSSSGTWTAPAGVTSVHAECWGGGAGGQWNSGPGGGGGEYAAEPALAVTPGNAYAYTVGAAGGGGTPGHGPGGNGGDTRFPGDALAVYAHGAPANNTSPSPAGSGSTNTVHHNGGSCTDSGGIGVGGGGGGGSGGPNSAGNPGGAHNGTTHGAGAPAVSNGGAGGNGGDVNNGGSLGGHPGGGGGSGGSGGSGHDGGSGGTGQVRLTYTLPSNAGGGGGGGSGAAAAAGNTGSSGSSGSGGAGAAAISGGGPGGNGGNDNTAGMTPSAGPGGGGGGGGAAVAGASGKPGQVRITYTQPGTPTLIASLAGAAGTDPEAGATVPAGYMGTTTAVQPGSSPEMPETWHPVTVPSGMTGTIRVKTIAEANSAELDINVTITSTLTTGTSYTAGSLPSSAYYPTGQRQYTLSVNQGTGSAPSSPRVNLPASGAIVLDMPGFATAGASCLVSGTIIYPLD